MIFLDGDGLALYFKSHVANIEAAGILISLVPRIALYLYLNKFLHGNSKLHNMDDSLSLSNKQSKSYWNKSCYLSPDAGGGNLPGVWRKFEKAGRKVFDRQIKIIKYIAEVIALMKNGPPAQSGLEGIGKDKLRPYPVIVNRHSPVTVMVFNHERIFAWPVRAIFHIWHRLRCVKNLYSITDTCGYSGKPSQLRSRRITSIIFKL